MANKIHIKVISVQHLLTLHLVTLVMTHQFSAMPTVAMFDYECLNCCWINAHMVDETIVVENMGMSLYLEKSQIYGEFAIYLIIYMAAMLVFNVRWSMGVFTILFEILTDENVVIIIDTNI